MCSTIACVSLVVRPSGSKRAVDARTRCSVMERLMIDEPPAIRGSPHSSPTPSFFNFCYTTLLTPQINSCPGVLYLTSPFLFPRNNFLTPFLTPSFSQARHGDDAPARALNIADYPRTPISCGFPQRAASCVQWLMCPVLASQPPGLRGTAHATSNTTES